MKTLWRDTLFKRLFVLMWVALVGSHLIAFVVVNSVFAPPGVAAPGGAPPRGAPQGGCSAQGRSSAQDRGEEGTGPQGSSSAQGRRYP